MLAPAHLPPAFADWNRRHRAPIGPDWWQRLLATRFYDRLWRNRFNLPLPILRAAGPFALQKNSPLRTFEYPWCFEQVAPAPGMRCLDVGSGASGFQFVLAAAGAHVTSVDPLLKPPGGTEWTFSRREFDRCNRAFGNKVTFIQDFLENADLPPASFDRATAVSVIEHIPPEGVRSLAPAFARLLKPGGRLIATIDLFLDCAPFTDKPTNDWGSNIDVRDFVERTGLRLILGEPAELHGYPQFHPAHIRSLAAAQRLVCNGVMTQCLVLER